MSDLLKLIESKRKQIIKSLNYHSDDNKTRNINLNIRVNWTDFELFKSDLNIQLTELDSEIEKILNGLQLGRVVIKHGD